MNGPSKITADYSSLVGLKAELLRKRLEVRELKTKNTTQNITTHHKPKVKVKKTIEKKESTPKVTEIEDINVLKKSKMMLEAKSRLYEKLKKSPRNKNDEFLVDFSNKSDPETDNEEDLKEEYYDSDDNFVEYKDCFGRTKKCLREDLPKMQEKDNLLRQQMSKEPIPNESDEKEIKQDSPQREPEIEIMRKKWEEQTNRLADKDNIFYQDVLFDEARTHGVGYYNFSIDEEERFKQQENLDKLRNETVQKQKEMQDLKEMRQKMEQNRLRVARIRQRIRAGLPPELPEEEDHTAKDDMKTSEESEPNVAGNKEESSEQVTKKEDSLAVIEDKVRAFGELLGKRTHWREMSQEEWVDKRRKDRLSEFAPKYDGFKSAGHLDINNSVSENDQDIPNEKNSVLNEDNNDSENIRPPSISTPTPVQSMSEEKEESDDSEIIGPMPFVDSIPLPPNPALSTIPLPPSPQKSTSNLNSNIKSSIDSDKIAAGLKYLRAKFEKNEKYES